MSVQERVQACIEFLLCTKDPDEIVDYLDIDSASLVDALYHYIDAWVVDNDWRPEDEGWN